MIKFEIDDAASLGAVNMENGGIFFAINMNF